VAEVTVGLKVVDRVQVPRPQGRPKKRPASLGGDKDYGNADFRQGLRRRHIQPSISRRDGPNRRRRPGRPSETHEVSKYRWKVERGHSWLDNWRRLVMRYDWYTHSYVAFLTITCFMAPLPRILEYVLAKPPQGTGHSRCRVKVGDKARRFHGVRGNPSFKNGTARSANSSIQ